MKVYLIRADVNTGHVLNEDFSLYLYSSENLYKTYFETLEEAEKYSAQMLETKSEAEFNIYKENGEYIKTMNKYK